MEHVAGHEQVGLDVDRQVGLDVERQLVILAGELSDLYRSEKQKTTDLAASVSSLRENQVAFARSFALVVEGNDPDTRTHLDRTQRWATAMARQLGVPHIDELQLGFLLHDIGKWSVPREIIQKPGPLTEAEWKVMRTHPIAGAQMVSDVPLLGTAIDVIRGHHERWDGNGYPYGLKGEDIPVGARVFSVADVFDALTSDRSYRAAMSVEEAVRIIVEGRGSAFDPTVVDVFTELVKQLEVAPPASGDVSSPPETPAR